MGLTVEETARAIELAKKLKLLDIRDQDNSETTAAFLLTEDGEPFRCGEIHRVMDRFADQCISEGMDMMIMAPVAHGKTVWALGWILRKLGKDQSLRVKIVSNKDSDAKDRCDVLAANIEKNPAFTSLYSGCVPGNKWGREGYRLKRDGGVSSVDANIQGYGILGGATGPRADVLFFDDATSLKNSILTPADREKVYKAATGGFTSRLSSRGIRLWLANPWHISDASSRMERDHGFKCLKIKVNEKITGLEVWIDGEHIEDIPLADEIGQTREVILKQKERLSNVEFQRLYHLRYMSDEDAKIKMDTIEQAAFTWHEPKDADCVFGETKWAEGDIILASDWAFSTRNASDEAVFMAGWRSRKERAANKKPVIYLLPGKWYVHGRMGEALYKRAVTWFHSFPRPPRKWGGEANGPQKHVFGRILEAAKGMEMPIRKSVVHELKPQSDKIADISVLVGSALELGELRLPKDVHGEWMMPSLIAQLHGLGIEAHDDHADTAKMVLETAASAKAASLAAMSSEIV